MLEIHRGTTQEIYVRRPVTRWALFRTSLKSSAELTFLTPYDIQHNSRYYQNRPVRVRSGATHVSFFLFPPEECSPTGLTRDLSYVRRSETRWGSSVDILAFSHNKLGCHCPLLPRSCPTTYQQYNSTTTQVDWVLLNTSFLILPCLMLAYNNEIKSKKKKGAIETW